MSVSSIVMSNNPVVSRPKPASFSMTFYDEGITRFVPGSEIHSLADYGWFHNASFDIEGPEDTLNGIFANGLARDVKIYDEYGDSAWEGLATTFIIRTRTIDRLVSLDNISNRQVIRVDVDGNTRAKTTPLNDTDSQNQYGIIEKVLHITKTASSRDNADNVKQVAEGIVSDPYKMDEVRYILNTSIPRGRAILSVRCTGYQFYLMRRKYNERTENTNANVSTIIANIITAKGDFVASTDIVTNTQKVNQFYDDDEMAWDIMEELTGESDNSNNKYIMGMREDRVFFYKVRATSTLDNVRLTRNQDRIISDTREGIISPIRIVPDQYIRDVSIMNDPGVVYANIRRDPQVAYIYRVVYRNANNQADIYSIRRTHRNRRLRKALRRAIAEAA